MDDPSSHLEPLRTLPVGGHARIVRIDGGRKLTRRLLGLGLRVGSEIAVLHHRGRGVVLASGDTRVALGGGIADKLLVQPVVAADPAATAAQTIAAQSDRS